MVDYRHYDFPATLPGERPVPVSDGGIGFGGWIAIILVTMLVSAAVTGGIFFLMMRSGGMSAPSFPGGPGGMEKEADPWGESSDDAKWAEARSMVGLMNSALRVIQAEESGTLPEGVVDSGTILELADALDLDANEFQSAYFSPEDYRLTIMNRDPAEYVIRVRSSMPEGPSGTWCMDQDGFGWMED